jgi:S-DNA-T family DNA segregation ATPase FtsK/SpoIIIE
MLGTNGAEILLGQGDMLMSLTDSSAMPRLQAAYATNDEIRAVVNFIKTHNVSCFNDEADTDINNPQQQETGGVGGMETGGFSDPQTDTKLDVFFKAAVKSVMMAGSASISYLQRRLGVGYSRAAKIVDQMEAKGYIAPATGAKTRKVLITPEQFREDFGEEYNS